MKPNETIREATERELALEEKAVRLGADQYNKTRPRRWNHNKVEETDLPPGRSLVATFVERLTAAITDYLKTAKSGSAGRWHSYAYLMDLAEPEAMAVLTLRIAINHARETSSFQSVAIELGNAVVHHSAMKNMRAVAAGKYRGILKVGRRNVSRSRMNYIRKILEAEGLSSQYGHGQMLRLGGMLLALGEETTGLYRVRSRRRDTYAIELEPEAYKRLEQLHAEAALLHPLYQPMVVPPKPWFDAIGGGYLSHSRPLIRGQLHRTSKLWDKLWDSDMAAPYQAINNLQSTAWRINRKILEVMNTAWNEGGRFGGFPPLDDIPLPERPFTEDDAAWREQRTEIHRENKAAKPERKKVGDMLRTASEYADEKAFWFPHSFDFRGRIYSIPTRDLDPQGDDRQRALLEFSEGIPLGQQGAFWLRVHMARLFGKKGRPQDLAMWAEGTDEDSRLIRQLILDSARRPLDGKRFWEDADKPWQFLAAAMEFEASLRDPNHVSHLPVTVDGTASGLQHLSALLGDPEGARSVNLLATVVPADVYLKVAAEAQATVDKDDHPMAAFWRDKKISREIAKQPTMTYSYAVTVPGMRDQILAELGDITLWKEARYLAGVMHSAVGEIVEAAPEAMRWLKDAAEAATKSGLQEIIWKAPDGFLVIQDPREAALSTVRVHYRGNALRIRLKSKGSKTSIKKTKSSIAANYVHSLDAAHLRSTVRALHAQGITSITTIHDSFGVHAAHVEALRDTLWETFAAQYAPDLLATFRTSFEVEVPPPPERKGWLPDRQLKPQHAFA